MKVIWGKFNEMLAIFSGGLLGLAMVVICTEVISRAVFNRPIVGVVDLITILIPVFVFLPLANTEIYEGHIRVELLSSMVSKKWQLIFDLATYVVGIIFLGLMAWVLWDFAVVSFQRGEYLPGIRRLPVWPSKFALFIGIFLFAIQMVINIIRVIRKLRP